ncbi:MAG TPA: helicase-related protein, partial [Thermoplasmata archaeon]|nr:helicase-related protein [Thermoplasmata archaeon]
LPTGLGKTAIALRVIAEYLLRQPTRSILVLAPTRPLALQHARSISTTLFSPEPIVLTGAVSPERRQELLRPPQVLVATPQVVANDLLAGGFPLEEFSLVVFDEAHRAVGDYPYVALGRALEDRNIRVLAMTASPGSRLDRIREVWRNLGIRRFEHRSPTDPDVVPYTHAIHVDPVEVPVPAEVRLLGTFLKTVVGRQLEALQKLGHASSTAISRRELLEIGRLLDRQIAAARARGEPAPGPVWSARTAQAIAMKANHAIELVETQGVEALRQYLARQHEDAESRRSPALRGFLSDPDVVEVERRLATTHLEHPKMATAVRIVTEELRSAPQAKVIVFTQYRQTAEQLVGELAKVPDGVVRAVRFVGQATHGADEGLSQRSQAEILDRFRHGDLNCLVATSVAEEGLDIPSTDLVVLYEPVPDEIRTIQRRGRTGRARAGRAIVLIAAGTRDEGMFRSAIAKERRMHEMLEEVESERLRPGELPPHRSRAPVQKMLTEFPDSAR